MSIPGIENLSPAVKYLIAFAIIFAMLVLLALILRRLTGGRTAMSSERTRARQPRLGIVDVYDLDRQRQLILLRRDNVEHLLLVGGPNDVVVETNIVRVPGARLQPAPDAVDRGEPADRNVEIAAVRPVLEPGLGRPGERGQDTFVGGHLGPSDALAALAGGRTEPAGLREPVLKPTRITPAPQPVADRAPARQPPPRANPQPNGSGVPNDMARQLEDVLRRPEPTPPQARPAPPPPRPQPEAAARPRPPEPVSRAPTPPRPEPAPSRPPPPPQAAAQPQRPPPPPPPPPPAAPPEPAPQAPGKPDPFSIEDIEAEFARLLGRPLDKAE